VIHDNASEILKIIQSF